MEEEAILASLKRERDRSQGQRGLSLISSDGLFCPLDR